MLFLCLFTNHCGYVDAIVVNAVYTSSFHENVSLVVHVFMKNVPRMSPPDLVSHFTVCIRALEHADVFFMAL